MSDQTEDLKGHMSCLVNCYGPCQLNLSSQHLREVHVVSCTSLPMDHINLACPSLEVLNVSGLSFLLSQEEVDFIASNVRELSPFLGSVKSLLQSSVKKPATCNLIVREGKTHTNIYISFPAGNICSRK